MNSYRVTEDSDSVSEMVPTTPHFNTGDQTMSATYTAFDDVDSSKTSILVESSDFALLLALSSYSSSPPGEEGPTQKGGLAVLLPVPSPSPSLRLPWTPTALGSALAWLFVNRPLSSSVTISLQNLSSPSSSWVSFGSRATLSTSPLVPVAFSNVPPPPPPNPSLTPSSCVDVYHLHAHFAPGTRSEVEALSFLKDVKDCLLVKGKEKEGGGGGGEGGGTERGGGIHDHVWKDKNGPHEGGSWELWVEEEGDLARALYMFMSKGRRLASESLSSASSSSPSSPSSSSPPSHDDDSKMYLLLHCDTGDEYTDHAARMCWVGDVDPNPLHLSFFRETEGYRGPREGGRRTDGRAVHSMGQVWERGGDGRVRKEAYGKVDREVEEGKDGEAEGEAAAKATTTTTTTTTTTIGYGVFLPHGSPPIPIEPCKSSDWLSSAAASFPNGKPSAIIFMSPHFFEDGFVLSAAERPATLMDFDADTDPAKLELLRLLDYPCAGAPSLASKASEMLIAAGLPSRLSPSRGLDHGVWTPLYVLYPNCDVPVVSLSVSTSLSAAEHIRAGRALSKLAAEDGVLLVGSGEVVHNVALMGPRGSEPKEWCVNFEGWLNGVLSEKGGGVGVGIEVPGGSSSSAVSPPPPPRPSPTRDDLLDLWRSAPGADVAHPSTAPENSPYLPSPGEHLMPLFFAFGAAGEEADVEGGCVFKEYLGSLPMAAYEFKGKKQ